jgi:hypothetical protein
VGIARHKGRSSFGMSCVHCADELIAPERSEYRYDTQVVHLWQCQSCGCSFEVISPADTKPIREIMRRIEEVVRQRDIFRSQLAA